MTTFITTADGTIYRETASDDFQALLDQALDITPEDKITENVVLNGSNHPCGIEVVITRECYDFVVANIRIGHEAAEVTQMTSTAPTSALVEDDGD
jgi:hypothetical protein